MGALGTPQGMASSMVAGACCGKVESPSHAPERAHTACRGGLSSRPRQDHLQIHIDPGTKFDYDSQLSALRGDVAKIKQVCLGWLLGTVPVSLVMHEHDDTSAVGMHDKQLYTDNAVLWHAAGICH
jgi:hypothetical protein